jgi:hypothetical protein
VSTLVSPYWNANTGIIMANRLADLLNGALIY